ncbi:glycine zipper 2TM domain-containing protein [Amaricoccus solimangrovi]|nr:glycine zipper 2TM domain-containing protein [Amaricoccus solimangrovi]
MKTSLILTLLAGLAAAGCTNNPSTNRNLQCAGGVLGGAAIGGVLGNQIGGGTGKQVATAVGAGAGAAAGTQLQACQ